MWDQNNFIQIPKGNVWGMAEYGGQIIHLIKYYNLRKMGDNLISILVSTGKYQGMFEKKQNKEQNPAPLWIQTHYKIIPVIKTA